jgi:hypothetical protein
MEVAGTGIRLLNAVGRHIHRVKQDVEIAENLVDGFRCPRF